MSFILSAGVITPPLTAGGVAYGNGAQAFMTGAGTTGQALLSNGAGVPAFGAVGVPGGGTGGTTFTLNNVLLGNGQSAFQTVAPGTSGNLLTSDGTTWQSTTPTASASGLTLIKTLTANNSATLTFTNTSITSSYDLYLFVFSNIKFVYHNRQLSMRVSTDNGATFISAAGSYSYGWLQTRYGSGGTTTLNNSATKILVCYPMNVGNAFAPPGSSFNGAIYMANPLDNSQGTQFWGNGSANEAATYEASSYIGGGYRKNAEADNAIQFYEDAGSDIASGTIQIFGVQK